MFHKLQPLIITMALLFSSVGHAESIAELQAAIKAAESKLSTISNEQSGLQAALADKSAEMEALASAPSPEKKGYEDSQRNFKAAESTYNATSTDENKAKMANAKFKMALAERKYKKSNRALGQLSDQQADLQEQIAANQKAAADLNKQIEGQKQQVAKLEQDQADRAKAQQAKRKNQELETQRAEVARLKAALLASEQEKASLLASQQAAKSVAKPAAAAAATAGVATASQASSAASSAAKAAPKATPAASTNKQAAAKKEIADAQAKTSPKKIDPNNTAATYLDSKDAVKELENRLSILLATPDKNKTVYDRMLNIKPADQTNKAKTRSQPLESLGHGQYKGKGKLESGDTIFAVGFYRWRQTINNSDNSPFTFVLDIADNKNPKLYYYPSSLAN